MKHISSTLVLLIASLPFATAQVETGDTQEKVMAVLGEPNGQIIGDDFEAYTFDRGQVIFRDGKVISHKLVSEEEAARRDERAQAQQQQLEEEREERIAKGEALLEQKKNDPDFASLPARDRVAFWEEFRRTYPEVDAGFEYRVARRQLKAEEDEMRQMMAEAGRSAQRTGDDGARYAPYYGGFPFVVFADRSQIASRVRIPSRGRGEAVINPSHRLQPPPRRADPDSRRIESKEQTFPPPARERATPLQDYPAPRQGHPPPHRHHQKHQ